MRMLWPQAKIAELLTDTFLDIMQEAVLAARSEDPESEVVLGDWTLVEFQYIPAESYTAVWQYRPNSQYVKVVSSQSGRRFEQVFQETTMVPVTKYIGIGE